MKCKRKFTLGGAVGGAQIGASIGSMIPIPGSNLIGAGIGGLVGHFKSNEAQDAEQERLDEIQQRQDYMTAQNDKQNRAAAQLRTLNNYAVNPTGATFQLGGNLTEYQGLPHEQGGIPLGNTGNEVEDGETRWQDYIFSDEIKYNKNMSFADMSKKIKAKYDKRDDKISRTTLDMEMNKLMGEQELAKSDFQLNDNMEMTGDELRQFKSGGNINIKSENKGKFTAWAKNKGMSVQEAARHILNNKDKYSSTQVKRANFARNAANWNKRYGGSVKYDGGGTLYDWYKSNTGSFPSVQDRQKVASLAGIDNYTGSSTQNLILLNYLQKYGLPNSSQNVRDEDIIPYISRASAKYVPNKSLAGSIRYFKENLNNIGQRVAAGLQPGIANMGALAGTKGLGTLTTTEDSTKEGQNNIGQKIGDWLQSDTAKGLGTLAATNMGALYDIGRGLRGGDEVNLQRLQASAPTYERIDPTTGRRLIQEQGSIGREKIRQTGRGTSSYLNNLANMIGSTQRGIGAYESDVANKNAMIGNREADVRTNAINSVRQVNLQQSNFEQDLNQREKDMARNTLQHGLTELSEGLQSAIIDRNVKQGVDKYAGNPNLPYILQSMYANRRRNPSG